MNKETFEKKYTELFDILHLELASIEFKKDLNEMLSNEIRHASIPNTSNLIAGYDYIPDED